MVVPGLVSSQMDEGVAETKVPCVVSIVHVSAVKHETPSRLVTAELLHRGQNLLTSLFFRDFFGFKFNTDQVC